MNINVVGMKPRSVCAAGAASASLDIGDGATVVEIVQQLAQTADEPLLRRGVLLDDAGAVRSSVMVFLDDAEKCPPLTSGRRLDGAATVTITSPISAGEMRTSEEQKTEQEVTEETERGDRGAAAGVS